MAEAVELVVPHLQGAVLVVEVAGTLDNLASIHVKCQMTHSNCLGPLRKLRVLYVNAASLRNVTKDVRA